jgi:hypothetical protein
MIGPCLGEFLEIAVERAAERDVQHLAPAADREQREARLDGRARVVQLDLVEVWLAGQVLRVWFQPAVPPGLDVPAAREHEPVEPAEQLDAVLGPLVIRQQHGERPGGEQRPPVPEPVVVAVVGEALRDADDRSVTHAQCPAGFSQPSSVAGRQSAPTVSDPATHGPSSGCGNFACCAFSWMP